MIVEKAANMAGMMNIPVLGIVENMSWFKCDACGKEHRIFGDSHVDQIAGRFGISDVARLPIEAAIAAACDNGRIEMVEAPWLEDLATALENV